MKGRIVLGIIAILGAVAMLSASAEARRGPGSGNAGTWTHQTQSGKQAGLCPLGNRPGSCPGIGRGAAFGPRGGMGNRGIGPRGGTGYGAKALGRGGIGTGICDGTGPKGLRRHAPRFSR